MKKKRVIVTAIILLLFFALFTILAYFFNDIDLFNYSIMDIFTTIIITVGIYFLTNMRDDIKSKNQKVEVIIDLVKSKTKEVFEKDIEPSEQFKYVNTFKYLGNKIKLLNNLSTHLKCDNEIKEIEHLLNDLNKYIFENISQGAAYFLRPEVKQKVPDILCDIELNLDQITLKIYDNYK